jgi:hypothetical protein
LKYCDSPELAFCLNKCYENKIKYNCIYRPEIEQKIQKYLNF